MILNMQDNIIPSKLLKYIVNLIIICAIFGFQFQWMGHSILIYRILVAFTFVLFIYNVKKIWMKRTAYIEILNNRYTLFYLTWLGWGLLSLLWVDSYSFALKNIYYLFIGVFFIILMQLLPRESERGKNYIRVFTFCTILLIAFGLFEHITGFHLPNSNHYHILNMDDRYRPTGVLNNTNDYAFFLSMFVWMIYYGFSVADNKFKKAIYFIVFLTGTYLLLVTASRASILAYILQLGVLFLLESVESLKKRDRPKRLLKPLLILGYIFIFLLMNHITDYGSDYRRLQQVNYWRIFKNKTPVQTEEKPNPSLAQKVLGKTNQKIEENDSVNVRKNLIKNALIMTKKSNFMGVGAGNTDWHMKKYNKIYYPTNKILNVHNWWIEILANYGIFIFLLYLFILLNMALGLIKIYFRSIRGDWKNTLRYTALSKIFIVILAGFPLSSISPSTIMEKRFMWIMFGFIIYFLKDHRIDSQWKGTVKHRE